jgi:hypothetical protein
MAINSDIKSAGLKYIAKENKVAKPNRTHIEGGQIGAVWNDDEYELKVFNPDVLTYGVCTAV